LRIFQIISIGVETNNRFTIQLPQDHVDFLGNAPADYDNPPPLFKDLLILNIHRNL